MELSLGKMGHQEIKFLCPDCFEETPQVREQEGSQPPFEPAKSDQYQGFDREEIESLVWGLDASIRDLTREIIKFLKKYDDAEVISTPLKVWNRIDSSGSRVEG
jgi:hypothetical protein